MKRSFPILIGVALLLSILGLWFKTPEWIHKLSSRVALASPENCADIFSENCAALFSRMGATGDTFGATSSLISSLALLLVALTLWLDGRARRETRKPLLISTLSADSVRLDDPKYDSSGSSIRLLISFALSNRAPDAALNVVVKARIHLQGKAYEIADVDVGMPIAGAENQPLESVKRLSGDVLQQLLTDLTGPSSEANLEVETIYTNLEGARWRTRVTYNFERVNAIDKQRLNAVRGNPDEVEGLWAGGPAVELAPVLRAGSWNHGRV